MSALARGCQATRRTAPPAAAAAAQMPFSPRLVELAGQMILVRLPRRRAALGPRSAPAVHQEGGVGEQLVDHDAALAEPHQRHPAQAWARRKHASSPCLAHDLARAWSRTRARAEQASPAHVLAGPTGQQRCLRVRLHSKRPPPPSGAPAWRSAAARRRARCSAAGPAGMIWRSGRPVPAPVRLCSAPAARNCFFSTPQPPPICLSAPFARIRLFGLISPFPRDSRSRGFKIDQRPPVCAYARVFTTTHPPRKSGGNRRGRSKSDSQ